MGTKIALERTWMLNETFWVEYPKQVINLKFDNNSILLLLKAGSVVKNKRKTTFDNLFLMTNYTYELSSIAWSVEIFFVTLTLFFGTEHRKMHQRAEIKAKVAVVNSTALFPGI